MCHALKLAFIATPWSTSPLFALMSPVFPKENLFLFKNDCVSIVLVLTKWSNVAAKLHARFVARNNIHQYVILNWGSTIIFADTKCTLHKWNSNALELEGDDLPSDNEDQSFDKQQLGSSTTATKLLGLPWDKVANTLSVCFPQQPAELTKREILSQLAKVHDQLGLVSPTTLLQVHIQRH